MTKYRLTPEIAQEICDFIRAGGYDYVAAEAAGIPRQVFRGWLARGDRQHPRSSRRYVEFAHEVCKARGQARLSAEVAVHTKDPKFWLCHGPGKEIPDEPGWSAPVKAVLPDESSVEEILNSPEVLALKTDLLDRLAAFPEARTAVGDVLQGPPSKNSAENNDFSPKSS
jgi:hypothetical protein